VRIRIDGDANGLPVEPDSLVFKTQLTIGSRVWVQFFGRRLLVLGKAGGVLEDTGWVDFNFTAANFTNYGGVAESAPRVRRFGKVVFLEGQAAPTASGATNVVSSGILTANALFTLPDPQFYPVGGDPTFVCQGSSQDRWALRAYRSGLVHAHRYGPGTPSTASWLPFNVTWMVD
jgi:hypothetical protein